MRKYKLELYDVTFYFFIGEKPETFIKILDEKFNIEISIDSWEEGVTTFDRDHKAVFMWIRHGSNMAATLCHESVHAACYALDWAGVYTDLKEDEALAYLAELIFLKAAPDLSVDNRQ